MAADYPSNPTTLIYEKGLTRITKMSEKPEGPHFAIIQFGQGTGWSPAYDKWDRDSTYNFLEQRYYWTTDRDVWERVLRDAFTKAPDRTDLMAFQVSSLPTINVSIKVEI